MTNSTSQAVTEVVGKIAGTHGNIRVTQPDGTIAVARSGAELLLGTTIETFGSSIVVVKIDGFKPVSLGHDTKITIDQALLDSMKDELEGSLDEQINFDALAQAIEGGENLEELLPATAAGGESSGTSSGSSNGSARFELTNDSVNPESGFETSATQNSETDSYIEDRDYFNNPPVAVAMPGVAINQDADFVFDVGLAFFEGDEGQTLSFDVGELPEGLSFDSETNLITGAATNSAVFTQDGTYNITITARDDSGAPNNSATNEFVLQVNNVNDAPVAGLPFDLGQIDEDGSITFDADLLLDGTSDIDQNDVLEVSNLRTENGDGALTDNGDGTYTFTPNANWYGDVDFTYDVSDGQGGAAANTGALNVASVNDLPVINPDFPLNIAPETTVNVDVLANDSDVDGDQLTVINVSAENGSVAVESDGSLTYTPFDDFVGNDTIEYTVSDGNGGEVAASIDVAVVYNPGVVTIDPLSEQETALPTISGSSANLVGEIVLNIDGNDYAVLPIKGGSWSLALPEGSELSDGTYEIVATGWDALGNPAMASETVVVDVEMPSISINEQDFISDSAPIFTGSAEHTDGDLTVELNGNTYSVTPNEDGSWSFTSPIELEEGEYTLTVSGGDAQGNSTSVSSEGLIDAQLPQIIINDLDETSSTPTFSGSAEHIDGDLTLNVNDEEYSVEVGDDGEWSITLPEDVVLNDGDYTVVVSGSDPQGNSTSVEDTFTVDEQMPSIVIDPIDMVENDQPVISGGSENIEGDITVVIGDDEYIVTPNEDGSWSIEIPQDGSLPDGDYTVVVEADDGQGNVVSEDEDFVVDAIDDVPTISGVTSASIAEDSADILVVSGDLDATGGDPGEDLFIAGQSAGAFGTFSVNENGTWEYQADNSQSDIQSLSVGDSIQESFVVTNADGVTSETVVVTITGTNDLPTLDAVISSSAIENDSAYIVNLLEGAVDIDANDVLAVSDFVVSSGDERGLVLSGNELSVDPNAFDYLAQGEVATINFEYFVEDNQGGRIAQSGSITITGQNDTPVVSQGINLGSLLEDGSIEITEEQLLNGASDIDGDTLTVENLELNEGQGSLADNGNGTWTFSPASDWSGSVSFDFEVNDGNVSVANTANLAVVAQNDAPEIIVVDGGIDQVANIVGKEFVGDDYDFSSQSEASDATGIDPNNVTVEQGSEITLSFISESGNFNNTLGWYTVDADGNINDVELVWENSRALTAGDSITINNATEGEIGFFIIKDGYGREEYLDAIDEMLAGNGVMRFETSSRESADVSDSAVSLYYYSDGTEHAPTGESVHFPIAMHSSYGSLGIDFYDHAHSGLFYGDSSTLVVGFEDLIDWPGAPGFSDWDLDDLVFSVQIRSTENYTSDIAPDIQIADDAVGLSAASVGLILAREGDSLALSEESETLATSYGIRVSYDAVTREMNLEGEASIAQYEDILSSVQLMNDEEFGTEPREINFSVVDAEGLESDIATVNLNSDDTYENSENDFIAGDQDDNELSGLLGDDIIFGAQGDDSMSGGEGSDTFIWTEGDEANAAQDSVADFEVGLDGDVLNFADLLEGEEADAVTLDAYFDIESDGTNTTLNIDVSGDASGADMSVVLEGVDLTVLGGDQAILQSLLDNGNLVTD